LPARRHHARHAHCSLFCEWEDLAVAEAATVLNTTTKAVESRLYRARQLLHKRLQQWL
jgi:DNA-directed RNA polymerase specialized sigma24 family protein